MRACPNCGRENPDEFRVCPICATPLPELGAPGRETRKVVTLVPRCGRNWRRSRSRRGSASTGLHTGEVVASAADSLVAGDAVNVAARLEQAAPSR